MVSSRLANVLQQLAGRRRRHVGGRHVQKAVAGVERVFVDASFGLDDAGSIDRSSVAAFTLLSTSGASHTSNINSNSLLFYTDVGTIFLMHQLLLICGYYISNDSFIYVVTWHLIKIVR